MPTIAVMVNMMTMIYGTAACPVVRWVGVIVVVASMALSAMMALIKRAGAAWFSTGVVPVVGQQLLDAAVELRGQPGQNTLEVGPRIMPVELGTLQQAHHHRSALAGQFAAYEEPIFTTDRNHGVILPMSGKRSRSSTAGTRCMGVA